MDIRKLVNINEWLLRRGYSTPEKKYMNPDGSATSRVFKLREQDSGELSVDVESLTTIEESIKDRDKYMLFKISNKVVSNELELICRHSPITDGSNDAHAVIIGLEVDDDTMPGLLARKSIRVRIS